MPPHTPDSVLLATLGERMRLARERAGYTATDAAKALGVGRRTLFSWESGDRSAAAIQIPRIAALYRVTCEWLLAPNVPFLALIDRKSERDGMTSRDSKEMDRIAKTLTVLVSEHLDSVSSPEQWAERVRKVYDRRSDLEKDNHG